MTDAFALDDQDALLEGEADAGFGEEAPEGEEDVSDLHRLMDFANTDGDISELLTTVELATLGLKVVQDWEKDDGSRSEWKMQAEKNLKRAAQERSGVEKQYPFYGASNVDFPLLTVASQQFAARAYPAIVKGDEAVGVKVFGVKPPPAPDPSIVPQDNPQAMQIAQTITAANQKWDAKEGRANRVKTFLNYRLFYGMEGWEDETDILLNQLPVVGTVFKKVYYDPDRGVCSDYVNPLRLTVPLDTKTFKRCPRITHDFDLYPYEIRQRQAQGLYRDVELPQTSEDEEQPRVVLEQHRLHDMDGDGIDEPYVITVDKESSQVLRIEAAYSEDDILIQNDKVVRINRWVPFVKFPFLRDPRGHFYELGFGQLLEQLSASINTAINELIDAGNAQVAGGGFVASGLRIQGPGQSSQLKWRPGEFKVVNASGSDLRNAVWERTLPNPSPVIFQLLDLMLGAAKDISAIKDVITGDAPTNAPVGTTLALIEQGLQVFTSIYKRIYRAEREEFQLIYECLAKWGGEHAAREYAEVLDDPQADFAKDFSQPGHDIMPVSDPTVVTRQQRLAKAQVIQQTAAAFPNAVNAMEAVKRIFEAADIDNPEALIAQPQGPPPGLEEELENKKADTALKLTGAKKNDAEAKKTMAEISKVSADAMKTAAEAGAITGEHHENGRLDAEQGRLGGVAGEPVDEMDFAGPAPVVGGAEGGVDASLMGEGIG